MTEAEMFAFMDTFRSIQRVFPLRGDEHEIRDVGTSYFKAMRRIPLADVAAGAEVWIGKGTKFPKPAEWIAAIPSRHVIDVRVMPDHEAREYRRAESLGYEDAPCGCTACVAAHVSEKPLRFVPDVDDQGHDAKAHDPIGKRIVTAGHWAHGMELQRLYTARANFWNRCYELGLMTKAETKKADTIPLEKRLEQIFARKGGAVKPMGSRL